MHKRLFYSTCTHAHTHTHSKYRHAYTNVTMVLLFEIDTVAIACYFILLYCMAAFVNH